MDPLDETGVAFHFVAVFHHLRDRIPAAQDDDAGFGSGHGGVEEVAV